MAECIVQEHGVLMARYDGSLPSGRWGLGALGGSGGADEEAHVDKLRGRSEALLSFTERVRSRLRRFVVAFAISFSQSFFFSLDVQNGVNSFIG